MSADYGNTSVLNPVDASNGSGTMPSWLGSAAPSSIDDAGRALQGAGAREWECRSYPTSTGTAPNFVVTMTVAPAALRTGQTYTFTAHAAAVGTDTLNANTLGAKDIKKVVAGTKTATAANDFYTGDKIILVYDGTDMVWVNKPVSTSGFAVLASANTFTATQTIQSTDAGANAGPNLALYRNSASPAASDEIGSILFQGEDSAGNTQQYARITAKILDPTDASEDSSLLLNAISGGSGFNALEVGAGIATGTATGGLQGAGTVNATEYYKNGVALGITLATPQATTSGSSINFTSIPAGVKRITVMFDGVSGGGTDTLELQIGDSGGLETSSYAGGYSSIDGTTSADTSITDGFMGIGVAAGSTLFGSVILNLLNSSTNVWVAQGVVYDIGSSKMFHIAGRKALSATLDRISLSGATFDAGAMNISYE